MKRFSRETVFTSSAGMLVLTFLVFPQVIVALASLDPGQFFNFPPRSASLYWFQQFLSDGEWRSSLLLTLTIATATGVSSTIIGGFAGIAVARAPIHMRRLLYTLLAAPLVIPVIVMAISFYGVVLRLHIVGSLASFVVANTLLTSPLVALLVVGSALGVDPRLEFASLSLGASRWRTLSRITVPMVAPTAMIGGLLAFLSTLDEVVMSIFLVAPGQTPLAVRMFLEVQTSSPPIVLAASTLLITSSILIVGSVALLSRLVTMSRGTAAIEVAGMAAPSYTQARGESR